MKSTVWVWAAALAFGTVAKAEDPQPSASSPLQANGLCLVWDAAKAKAPTFAGAPVTAELPSQGCTLLPSGAWGCELKFSDSCTRVERGSPLPFGKVFGEALDDATACYRTNKGYKRTNIERIENKPDVRKRILREAFWTGAAGEPVVVASADITNNYQKLDGSRGPCSIVAITIRVEVALPGTAQLER